MSADPEIRWTLDPMILLALAAYAGIYAWRFRGARREAGGRGAGLARAAAFAAAMLALAAALISPIAALGEEHLFSMHMLQHVLLGDIAPVLLLLSLSRVIMRPATRRLVAIERRLGRLAHPAVFLAGWLGLVYVWHIPALYDAATQTPALHALEHASFFAAGVLFWWPLVQPVPMRHRMTGLQPFVYIGAGKALLAGLGVFLTWSNTVVYSHYETVPRIWGLSALDDQNVGGAIMMAEQSIVLAIAFATLFVLMIGRSEEEERRRERLEEAAAT
ncbi:MAG: cytochrome c oxidase assembly protein [Thermoleophilaceae bacterium]